VRDVYGWTLADGCAVKLKELTSAGETFDRALKLARLLKDRDAENAIRRAIDDINCTLAKRPPRATDTDSRASRGNQLHQAFHSSVVVSLAAFVA